MKTPWTCDQLPLTETFDYQTCQWLYYQQLEEADKTSNTTVIIILAFAAAIGIGLGLFIAALVRENRRLRAELAEYEGGDEKEEEGTVHWC